MTNPNPRSIVEAFRWPGHNPDQHFPAWFLAAMSGNRITMESHPNGTATLSMPGRSWADLHRASRGDWIVKDADGVIRPYRQEAFEARFEVIHAQDTDDGADSVDVLPVIRAVISEVDSGLLSSFTLPELRARILTRQAVGGHYVDCSYVAA